jgi:hypothetical protein
MPALCPVASADQPDLVGSVGKPPLSAKIDASWPTVLSPNAPSDRSAHSAAGWSPQEVAEGRAHCAALLKDLDVVAVPVDPIYEVRDGETCGTPAPMQLVSIGSSPQIAVSPPATLTCDMIAALHKWLVEDAQPLARKHLRAPIVGVKTMSSFSCRTAYSRAKTRLSEHGRVNALDLGGFVTASGETRVIADWGPTAREFATKVDPAQAEAIKRQAEAAAAARKARRQDGPRLIARDTRTYEAGTAIPFAMPRITFRSPSSGDASDLSTGLGWAPPSRLGGPKAGAGAPAQAPSDGKATFLHEVHDAACTIISTVLGPEANAYHKNHFHLDLAERKSPSICE